MNNEIEILEQQVEGEWSAMRLDFAVEPSAAVVERVRSAARQELNEGWLAGQPQPVPDDDLLNRVTTQVHRELAGLDAERTRVLRLRRWLAAGAVAAAAAAVVLVVGIPRFNGAPLAGDRTLLLSDADAIERFAQAADQVWSADPLDGAMRDDLDAIEESVTQWPQGGESEPESFDDLDAGLGSPGGVGGDDRLSDAGGTRAGVGV